MSVPILITKLFKPPFQNNVISRPLLVKRLNDGLLGKLTLISASAGFGKTVLLSEWAEKTSKPVAWISLDDEMNDQILFISYFLTAINNLTNCISKSTFESIKVQGDIQLFMISLINDITTYFSDLIIVLDDYHYIENRDIDTFIAFFIENAPTNLHIIIATREDPNLPLAKLRGNGQLSEIRIHDLRFSVDEIKEFFNVKMNLNIHEEEVLALESRTEGWIAGLRLAGISMNQSDNIGEFIRSFSGNNHYILGYLLEEVFTKLPVHIQLFLMSTSILDRFCGPLCDALLPENKISGYETLQFLEQINLFVVPLDGERYWYRYHHLFSELLHQRLLDNSERVGVINVNDLHKRAGKWLEEQELYIEAFAHTTAAGDVVGAQRLVEGKGIPLQFLGALKPIMSWLGSLPIEVLNQSPSLWVTYASVVLGTGQTIGIEEKLLSAEKVISTWHDDQVCRDIRGRIASTRASLHLTKHDAEAMIVECHLALKLLNVENTHYRVGTLWNLGYAYQVKGKRKAARKAYTDAISTSQNSGNVVIFLLSTMSLGQIEELDNELVQAEKTYLQVLALLGEIPLTAAKCMSHLGLARIYYQWNVLNKASEHIDASIELAPYLVNTDIIVTCEVIKSYIALARENIEESNKLLIAAEKTMKDNDFVLRRPEITEAKVILLIKQNLLDEAVKVARTGNSLIGLGRVYLASGASNEAITILESLTDELELSEKVDELIKARVLLSLCYKAKGNLDIAVELLSRVIVSVEPEKCIRLFLNEGTPIIELLYQVRKHGVMKNYVKRLIEAFKENNLNTGHKSKMLNEPLSHREIEILELINQGCTNKEICGHLFLAIDTVKGHNRRIFAKLEVRTRTEAIKKAISLGIID